MALTIAACGGSDGELTAEEHLVKLAGDQLTEAEMDEQLALADMLCGFDSRLLTEIWHRLDARQLEFQDFVFGRRCPERVSTYEEVRPETNTVPEEILEAARTTTTNTTTTTRPTTSTTIDLADVLESVEAADDAEVGSG